MFVNSIYQHVKGFDQTKINIFRESNKDNFGFQSSSEYNKKMKNNYPKKYIN